MDALDRYEERYYSIRAEAEAERKRRQAQKAVRANLLEQGVKFHTFKIVNEEPRCIIGLVTVATVFIMGPNWGDPDRYKVAFAFCSPLDMAEYDLLYGEVKAGGRLMVEDRRKKAVYVIPETGVFTIREIKEQILGYASMHEIKWMKNVTIEQIK